mmetsp:Transcript_67937/g.137726  ORF Transcript_67937/g.137726 Transcript_67937/m.137726 type:complete len:104 (+) Transcript_67937:322-633(+)
MQTQALEREKWFGERLKNIAGQELQDCTLKTRCFRSDVVIWMGRRWFRSMFSLKKLSELLKHRSVALMGNLLFVLVQTQLVCQVKALTELWKEQERMSRQART